MEVLDILGGFGTSWYILEHFGSILEQFDLEHFGTSWDILEHTGLEPSLRI